MPTTNSNDCMAAHPVECEITWRIIIRVWWEYIWRWFIAMTGIIILSYVLGLLINLFVELLSVPSSPLVVTMEIIGRILGFSMTILPFRFILGKQFGNFRLIVVPAQFGDGAANQSQIQIEPNASMNGGGGAAPRQSDVREGPTLQS